MESHLRTCIDQSFFPGAVWWIEGPRETLSRGATGNAAVDPGPREARLDTIYDLASVTKAVSTALLLAVAHREGVLSLDEALSGAVPELAGSAWAGITARDCMLHRAGLPAWAPLYCLAASPGDCAGAIAALPGAEHGGVLYSDLGPILTGFALRNRFGRALDELFRTRIAEPLELRDTGFCPPAALRERIAPTERGTRKERELAEELPGEPCRNRDWPTELFHGVVHDGNARHLGGAAGHAGLFGTAEELGRIGRELLNPSGRVLQREDAARLLAPAPGRSVERRCLLGQMAAGSTSPATALNEAAAGHVGYTGCSFFVDPDRNAVFVLLTNRVHPADREDFNMNEVRREFHQAALRVLEAGTAE